MEPIWLAWDSSRPRVRSTSRFRSAEPLAGFGELGFGLVALGLRAAVFLFLLGGLGREGLEPGGGQVQVQGGLGGLPLEQPVAAREHAPQLGVHLRFQLFVAARLGRLALERVDLPADLFQDVEDPLEVLLGAFELGLGQPPARS